MLLPQQRRRRQLCVVDRHGTILAQPWWPLRGHARGAGVARRLYDAVEQTARATGLSQLTAVASLRAVPVFERFGFTEVGRSARLYHGQTFHVLHMAKRLDAPPRTP